MYCSTVSSHKDAFFLRASCLHCTAIAFCPVWSACGAALCRPSLTILLDAASCESSIRTAMLASSASVAHHGVALLCSCAAATALDAAALERLLRVALSASGGDALKGYYSHMLVLPLVGLPGAPDMCSWWCCEWSC
jgi:hypothetical protein